MWLFLTKLRIGIKLLDELKFILKNLTMCKVIQNYKYAKFKLMVN